MSRLGGGLTTLLEGAVVLVALYYVLSGDAAVLFVWEILVSAYLVGGLVFATVQARRGVDTGRRGVLGALSWVLPLIASAAGVVSALVALSAQSSAARGDQGGVRTVVAAAVGIVLSWLLLQVGMAQSYEAGYLDDEGNPALRFPATEQPVLVDFLYFSFGVGAAFATSDTQVLTRRTRLLVVLHSSVAFFYSAFVVAVAYQVLQSLVTS